MSIEVDWSSLDAHLTQSVVEFLTSAFTSAPRPDYLGEIAVTSFSFGDAGPELELLDLRDVYREFLEDHQDDIDEEQRLREEQEDWERQEEEQRATQRERQLDQERWQREQRERGRERASNAADGPRRSTRSDSPHQSNSPLRPGLFSHASSSLFSPGLHHSLAPGRHSYLSSSISLPQLNEHLRESAFDEDAPMTAASSRASSVPIDEALPPLRPSAVSAPSIQLHLLVKYRGNMNVGLSTSLLINYPSPMFMSLPLKLSVTSLAFEGTFVLAYEGDRRRVHLSILNPKDGDDGGIKYNYSNKGNVTAGARLLHSAVVDSEVGQSNKHVLKNVGKVEKFVLDVMRSTLESELVFPNYQTVMF